MSREVKRARNGHGNFIIFQELQTTFFLLFGKQDFFAIDLVNIFDLLSIDSPKTQFKTYSLLCRQSLPDISYLSTWAYRFCTSSPPTFSLLLFSPDYFTIRKLSKALSISWLSKFIHYIFKSVFHFHIHSSLCIIISIINCSALSASAFIKNSHNAEAEEAES